MLPAVAFAVVNALPSTCPHDAIARPVERGVITSPARPAIAIRVGRPAWQALRASLAERSRQAFEVVKPGPGVAAVAPSAPAAGPERTRLILLGTRGGPRVGEGRGNPSTLLMIGGTPYVVDCGYGTSRQLVAAGVPLNQVRYIFVTHHHSDHNLELGPLAYNAWVAGPSGRIDAYGPPGVEKMAAAFFEYMKLDIETRIVDEGRSDPRALLVAHDVAGPGVVLENAQVKVTAARVAHPMVEHAYAYRFDTKDRSVVISGDTTFSAGLVELARGADVLVHEVLYPPGVEGLLARVPNAARLRPHLFASHTTAEDVGRVAALAGVRTLVLTHFVPPDDPGLGDEQWAEEVRKHFAGRVIVGRDLMEIPYDAKP